MTDVGEGWGDMPFIEGGNTSGAIGSGLPTANMIIAPDKILALKHGFEDRRDIIREFITVEYDSLANVRPPGADPASAGGAEALSENGRTALNATRGYIDQLTRVIDALDASARQYGLTEDANAQTFRQSH